MTISRFRLYELRTTDVDAARAFYQEVLGAGFWGPETRVAPLPGRVAARGAPAHWLGHIDVADAEAAAGRMAALGGVRLGPAQRSADGSDRVVMRDPYGAIVALGGAAAAAAPADDPVGWHLLHTRDHERAFAGYAGLFGWPASDARDLGPLGRHQMFAWTDGGPTVGSVADTARQPHIHTHWLFFFRVADIGRAIGRVRAAGGTAQEPVHTARGDVIAPCEDPQGAATGLIQLAPSL